MSTFRHDDALDLDGDLNTAEAIPFDARGTGFVVEIGCGRQVASIPGALHEAIGASELLDSPGLRTMLEGSEVDVVGEAGKRCEAVASPWSIFS